VATLPIAVATKNPEIPEELWEQAGWLPCSLTIDIPLKHFTVRDLLCLEPGTIVESRNLNGADVPVLVNSQVIGWSEFEVVGQRLAVRLTELT
jgi:flagellar motor switch/type III secretory pathway protein FliN